MNERNMQTRFTKWLKVNGLTGAYELKFTKEKSIPFSAVKEHQIVALLKVKHGRLAHKISDSAFGMKPFDVFCLHKQSAYVVVSYYVPNKPWWCFLIDVDKFIEERDASKRKSLTRDRAAAIGLMERI